MEEKQIAKKLFSDILADYFATYNVDPFSVNINIVDDMWEGYLKIRPDHAEMNSKEMEEFQRKNKGTAIPPQRYDDLFTILLQREYLEECVRNNKVDWIGTLVHEVAHVNDFMQFSKIVGVRNYDIILNRDNYRMFHLWTEFNAKVKGYYFLRKYTFGEVQNEEQVKFIVDTELPYHIKDLFEVYHSTNNGDWQMYYVVHFLGRLYVWQKLFPQYFTERSIKDMLTSNIWMYELYMFLSTHTKLEDAYRDFKGMKNILKQNFDGL